MPAQICLDLTSELKCLPSTLPSLGYLPFSALWEVLPKV